MLGGGMRRDGDEPVVHDAAGGLRRVAKEVGNGGGFFGNRQEYEVHLLREPSGIQRFDFAAPDTGQPGQRALGRVGR